MNNILDSLKNDEIIEILSSQEKSKQLYQQIVSVSEENRYDVLGKIATSLFNEISKGDRVLYDEIKNYFNFILHVSDLKKSLSYKSQLIIYGILKSEIILDDSKIELLNILKDTGIFKFMQEKQTEAIKYLESDTNAISEEQIYEYIDTLNITLIINNRLNKLYEEEILSNYSFKFSTYELFYKKIFSELSVDNAINVIKKYKGYSLVNGPTIYMSTYIAKKTYNNIYIDNLIKTYLDTVINGYIQSSDLRLSKDKVLISFFQKKDDPEFQNRHVYLRLKDKLEEIYPLFLKQLYLNIYNELLYKKDSVSLEFYANNILLNKFNKEDKTDFLNDPYLPIFELVIDSKKDDGLKNKIQSIFKKNNMLEFLNNYFDGKDEPENDSFESLVTFSDNAYINNKTITLEQSKRILKHHILSEEPKVPAGSLRSALISIIQNKLKSNSINDYSVIFIPNDSMACYGQCDVVNRNIYINENRFKKFYDYEEDSFDFLDSVLTTVYHETKHAIDFNHVNTFSYKSSIIIKDRILVLSDKNYVSNNYRRISYECYAKRQGAVDTYNLLRELAPDIALKYLNNCIKKIKIENKILLKYIRKADSKQDNLLSIFDSYMLQHPETSTDYPLLKYEYNEDGCKRHLVETIDMLVSDKELLGAPIYSYIYNYININFASQKSFELFVEEYERLNDYSCSDEKVNKIINILLEKTKGFYEIKKGTNLDEDSSNQKKI